MELHRLLADRLQVMMPVLPGLIVSLLPHSSRVYPPEDIPSKSVIVLSGILTAVGGAFHRVFGGVIHSASGQRGKFQKQSDTASATIKAAKTYVPHLLTVTMILDETMRERELVGSVDRGVDICRPIQKLAGTGDSQIRTHGRMSRLQLRPSSMSTLFPHRQINRIWIPRRPFPFCDLANKVQ